MIIATTQDLEEVGSCGCPCTAPACAAPRVECQSITISACGFSLPDLPGIPPEDRCKLWRSKKTVGYYHLTYVTAGYDQSLEQTDTYHEEKFFTGLVCGNRIAEATFDSTQSSVVGATEDWQETFHATGNHASPCAGTHTYTDNIDPGNNLSEEFLGCPTAHSETAGAKSYADGVLSFSETIVSPDGTTTSVNSWTQTWLPADLEWLTTQAGALLFPDHVNGSQCSSQVLMVEDCDQVESVTRARYKVGVPAGYSTLENPRSTFEAQWDEVFFPDGWNAMIDDPAYVPPVPNDPPEPVPQIPDPAAPSPVLVASRSWTWGGSMEGDAQWSAWFAIAIPTGPGEVRRVNMMTLCHRSARIGQKPTAHGEQFIPAA